RTGRGRRRTCGREGFSILDVRGNGLAWVGADLARPGRGGHGTGPPGDRRLAGNWGSAGCFILLRRAGRRLCPPRPHGRRPPGAGRGPHPAGAAGGTLVGSGNLSPPGRLAPAAAGNTAGGGGRLA